MDKDTNCSTGKFLSEHVRHQQQVIVVDPD